MSIRWRLWGSVTLVFLLTLGFFVGFLRVPLEVWLLRQPHVASIIFLVCVALALVPLWILLGWLINRRICSERDIVPFGLPVLASVPNWKNTRKLTPWLRGLTIESFLQIVTFLLHGNDAGRKTLVFTSPDQGDGKSLIAMNVAIAFASVAPRVLIVDADVRRPSLHAKFEVSNEIGLADVLAGSTTLMSSVLVTRHAGLDLLTSGTHTDSPYQLLQSERFDYFLEEALRVYRLVIIDSPALEPVIDATVLCKKASATILVLGAGDTQYRSLETALQRLSRVGVSVGQHNLLGVILNRTRPAAKPGDEYTPPPGTASLRFP